ncbi:hypothetical protein Tco_1265439 [Tanacetum coccineum]
MAKIVQNRETGSLPILTEVNSRGLAQAITMRSGLNYKPPGNPLEKNKDSNNEQKNGGTNDRDEEKERGRFRKFFKKLQQLSINIPFVGALERMPKYAKFMKDLLTNKVKFEETSKVTLNEISAVLLNKIPLKEKDTGSFTILCAIRRVEINKALVVLRASISFMPYSMFVRLELGELKSTRMRIELANKSTQYPMGIVENFIVKIDKFVFPVDFVLLDMVEDFRILIILRRPFLATTHTIIDVFNKKYLLK